MFAKHMVGVVAVLSCCSCTHVADTDDLKLQIERTITKEQRDQILIDYASRSNNFATADVDGSGYIDRGEFGRFKALYVFSYDLNHDGTISRIEFVISQCPVPLPDPADNSLWHGCAGVADRNFRRLDGSGDGQVTEAEYLPFETRSFAIIDRCRDDKLTLHEWHGGPEKAAREGRKICPDERTI